MLIRVTSTTKTGPEAPRMRPGTSGAGNLIYVTFNLGAHKRNSAKRHVHKLVTEFFATTRAIGVPREGAQNRHCSIKESG